MTETPDPRRGHKLQAQYANEWSRLRLAHNLSITELARLSGVRRSYVGLICQGRMNPTPEQARDLLAILSGPETL